MSALRKKIESNTGLPPSILEMGAFWSDLTSNIADWATKSLGVDTFCKIIHRKVLTAEGAGDALNDDNAFLFSSSEESARCAIALDRTLLVRCAAHRFGEDVESITSSSEVFLRLASEMAILSLWNSLTTDLMTPARSFEPALEARSIAQDPKKVNGGEYVETTVQIVLDNVETNVSIILPTRILSASVEQRWGALTELRKLPGTKVHSVLRTSVRTSSINISAILDRVPMTVGECSRIEIGQIIPLSSAEPGRMCLSTETVNGPLDIAYGELGIWKDVRAIKLDNPVSNSFLRNVAEL